MPLVIINRNVAPGPRSRAIFFERGDGGIRAVEYLITRRAIAISPVLRCLFILPTGITRSELSQERWKNMAFLATGKSEIPAITR